MTGPLSGPLGHVLYSEIEMVPRLGDDRVVYGSRPSMVRETWETACRILVRCPRCMSMWQGDLSERDARDLIADPGEQERLACDMAAHDPAYGAGRTPRYIRGRYCDDIRDEKLVAEVMET